MSGSLAKANERKEAWFGYYWAPTAILGKYQMVKVDFGTGVHEKEFVDCITQAECENPTVSMYPTSPVYTVTTEKFANQYPDVNRYFVKRGFTNNDLNKLLAWMEDNQADSNDAMEYFLTTYPQIWHRWVPEDVAKKVESAL